MSFTLNLPRGAAPRRLRHNASLAVPLALAALCSVPAGGARAEDTRQLATLPPAAQETLRQEMLDNLIALNEILGLVAADKLREAGDAAEQKLGMSAMGRHRDKPFEARPGPHMPPAMHALGIDGHRAASEFARAAQAGDRARALNLLPGLTSACIACHHAYRVR